MALSSVINKIFRRLRKQTNLEHFDVFRSESVPCLSESRHGLVSESAHDRKHRVEVLRVLAVSRYLDVVLHQLDALEDGGLAHDLAHHPKHLLVDQTREALQVGVGGLRVQVEQLVDVLCGFNALEELEVAKCELCCNF